MKIFVGGAVLVAALLIGFLAMSGCQSNPTPPDPATIADLIQVGTSTSVSLGMMAVPNDAEAIQACKEALGVLDANVLPLLKGDEAALVSGLEKIMSLEAFNNPKLEKVKLILDMALPLVKKKLPANLIDGQLAKVDPTVKLYVTAFFTGARQGLADYLGQGTRGSVYQDLKVKLAK